jgi:hypothetical protein
MGSREQFLRTRRISVKATSFLHASLFGPPTGRGPARPPPAFLRGFWPKLGKAAFFSSPTSSPKEQVVAGNSTVGDVKSVEPWDMAWERTCDRSSAAINRLYVTSWLFDSSKVTMTSAVPSIRIFLIALHGPDTLRVSTLQPHGPDKPGEGAVLRELRQLAGP